MNILREYVPFRWSDLMMSVSGFCCADFFLFCPLIAFFYSFIFLYRDTRHLLVNVVESPSRFIGEQFHNA